MKLTYFQLRLKNSKVMNFDKECNKVSYSDEKLCVFLNTTDNSISQRYQTLALVPYDQIALVERITEEV